MLVIVVGSLSVPHASDWKRSGPCYWRVLDTVKVVAADCQEEHVYGVVTKAGSECFSQCSDPSDQKSDCWASCFFETVLGEGVRVVRIVIQPLLPSRCRNMKLCQEVVRKQGSHAARTGKVRLVPYQYVWENEWKYVRVNEWNYVWVNE